MGGPENDCYSVTLQLLYVYSFETNSVVAYSDDDSMVNRPTDCNLNWNHKLIS